MSVAAARVAARAKLNLHLRVLGREATGYHSIETIFALTELADTVVVRVGGRGRSVDVEGPAVPTSGLGPSALNLAYRAADAYAAVAGWPAGFAVEIEKRIPVGGGLGGGSADAAAVLRALDALAPRPLGTERLLRLAGDVGSDVPFLTAACALAIGWSRGERLLALPPLPARELVLGVPPFAVATRDAYQWLAQERGGYRPVAAVIGAEATVSWDGLAPLATNDFEPIVAARHPTVGTALAALRAAGAVIARMSGSGSVVFGVFERAPALPSLAECSDWRLLSSRTVESAAAVERIA